MKSITIRGIEPEIAEKLKKTAEQEGKSVNQYMLDSLKQLLGFTKSKQYTREYSDLDNLFGRWTDDEFKAIHDTIADSRQIEEELWQ